MVDHARRMLIAGSLGLAAALAARPSRAALPDAAAETLALWPGTPPGGDGIRLETLVEEGPATATRRNRRLRQIGTPTLVVMRPARPNGTGMIIVPGGGFSVLNYDLSGLEPARWLNERGIAAFILLHRLPGEGWSGRADVPLQDAQRAIRLVRARATGLGVDPARIGVLGFSAGGHVAGSLATRFADHVYDPVDGADALSARPDLAALLFPVISMVSDAHAPSRALLLGADPSPGLAEAHSLERQVPADMPPLFLCCAGDDRVVSPANSLAMYRAALAAGQRAELHIFQKGGHGFALRLPASAPTARWPDLMLDFARFNGLLDGRAAD